MSNKTEKPDQKSNKAAAKPGRWSLPLAFSTPSFLPAVKSLRGVAVGRLPAIPNSLISNITRIRNQFTPEIVSINTVYLNIFEETKYYNACKNLSLQNPQTPKMLKEQHGSSSSVFLFPNPNPLLRSFNIPEPIIRPPGIDPCSFLNPKPHADDKVKPMAPLDVDPCAEASRTDVIANATHLTASEHAGGSFAEPPMAPMDSDSPAHSETSAPQIIYDVEEAKIESKNAQRIHCDVCNVICTSEGKLREHKEGKKHLKKFQKLPVSVSSPIVQEKPPPVANAASIHESENKKSDSLENAQSVESLHTRNIPDLVSHDRNIFTEHPEGEKQETQVTNVSLDTLVQSSNNGTEKVEDVILWCEICKVTCMSKRNLLRHNIGKKHLKNLKISEKMRTPPSIPTAPPISKPMEEVDNFQGFRKHVKGKSYRMNHHESEKITDLPPSIIQPNDLADKVAKGEVVNPSNGSFMRCELCGIFCTSSDELSRHLSGKKHMKAVHSSEKLKGQKMLAGVMNEEGKVVILEMGKRKANGSLVSEEDEDVKRKKMMEEESAFGASISCYLCNVVCTSLVAFRDHLAGQEHSAMVLKQVK
ncbi:hypothetical protein LXL04_008679 [Taraxacum kok-saghyz]